MFGGKGVVGEVGGTVPGVDGIRTNACCVESRNDRTLSVAAGNGSCAGITEARVWVGRLLVVEPEVGKREGMSNCGSPTRARL